MILLDTNSLIHYLKGVAVVVDRLQHASPKDLGVPSVCAYELEYGTLKGGSAKRRAMMAELLAGLTQVPLDQAAAAAAARIRIELEAKGHTIGPMDLLIAGTAMSRGATLVTNNTKEFGRIKGLRLVDWTR